MNNTGRPTIGRAARAAFETETQPDHGIPAILAVDDRPSKRPQLWGINDTPDGTKVDFRQRPSPSFRVHLLTFE